MKRLKHKKVQHEKGAARRNCNMKREKCEKKSSIKIAQYKKGQHEKSAT